MLAWGHLSGDPLMAAVGPRAAGGVGLGPRDPRAVLGRKHARGSWPADSPTGFGSCWLAPAGGLRTPPSSRRSATKASRLARPKALASSDHTGTTPQTPTALLATRRCCSPMVKGTGFLSFTKVIRTNWTKRQNLRRWSRDHGPMLLRTSQPMRGRVPPRSRARSASRGPTSRASGARWQC